MAFEGLAALNTEWYPLSWWRRGENTPKKAEEWVKVPSWKGDNWEPWRGGFLKFYTVHEPEKVGTVSPSSDTGTIHVTLVKVPSCQLSYTLCFQALWSSGSENYTIVKSCVHYTLRSKSRYYIQNKILSLHSWLVKGWQLWTQSDTL